MSFNQAGPGSPEQNISENGVSEKEQEQAEQLREKFDRLLVDEIIEKGKKDNEGNNGIILKIRFGNLSSELKDALQEEEVQVEDDQAVKMLKVYKEGKGRREFQMQKKAREIINKETGTSVSAKVPKPNLHRDVELSEKEQEVLAEMADWTSPEERAEFLMMEYIEGDDLYTYMIKELAERHPNLSDMTGKTDEMRFDEVERRVQQELNFKEPSGDLRGEDEKEHQKQRVLNQNQEVLYKSLKKKGAHVNREVLEQVKNAVDALHEAGYAHRDLHERNIMVNGNPFKNNEETQAFMIDFDQMQEIEGNQVTPSDYEDDQGRRPQDQAAIGRFEKYFGEKDESGEVKTSGMAGPLSDPNL